MAGMLLTLTTNESAQNVKTTPNIPTEALMRGVIKPAREKPCAVRPHSHQLTNWSVVCCFAVSDNTVLHLL